MKIAIWITIAVVMFGIFALSAFMAYKRGFFKSLIKLVTTLASLGLAFVLSVLIGSALSGLFERIVFSAFGSLLNQPTMRELLEASPAIKALIFALPTAIMLPFVFFILFFVLKFIFDVVFFIISSCTFKKRQIIDFEGQRFVSCALGLVIAFVCMVAFTLPFNGVISMASDIYVAVADTVMPKGSENAALIGEVVDGLDSNPLKVATSTVGGNALYNGLTTFEYEGRSYSAGKEVQNFTSVAGSVLKLGTTSTKNWSEREAQALSDISHALSDSDFVPIILSEALSFGCEKLSEGEKFAGISIKESSDYYGIVMYIVEQFKNSTEKTVKEDINTLGDSVALLVRKGAFSALMNTSGSKNSLLDSVANDDVMGELFEILCDNERFVGIIPYITDLVIEKLAVGLKIPTDRAFKNDFYADVFKEIDVIIKNNDIKDKNLAMADLLEKKYGEYGIKVSRKMAEVTGALLFEKLTSQNTNPTKADVAQFFDVLYSMSQIEGAISREALEQKYGEKWVADNFSNGKQDIEGNIQTYINILNAVKAVNVDEAEKVLSLSYETPVLSSRSTIEGIMSKLNYDNATPADYVQLGRDISAIARDVAGLADAMTSLKGQSTTEKLKNFDVGTVGNLFDKLSGNAIIGDAASDIMGDYITKAAGLDVDFKDIIDNSDTPGVGNSNYSDVLSSVQDTVKLFDDIKDDSLSHTEKVDKVYGFIDDLDSASATSVSKLITPDIVKDLGVPEENAEVGSGMLSTMLSELGKTEDTSGKEAEAVKYLLDVAAISQSPSQNGVFGENGKIESSQEFVDKVLASDVATKSIISSTTSDAGTMIENPLGIASGMNENDMAELDKALTTAAERPGTSAEDIVTLKYIANMFGSDWTLGE